MNLLTDGDMEDVDTSAWTKEGNPTLTKETADPYEGSRNMKCEYNGTDHPMFYQSLALTAGHIYRISGVARSDGGRIPKISTSVYGLEYWSGTTSTSWQSFDFERVAFVSDSFRFISLYADAAGEYVEWDNLSVQLTRRNLLLDGWMEKSDAIRWHSGNGATLTKETGTPYEGSRCLRCAYNGTNTPLFRQDNRVVVGRTYRLTGYARSDGVWAPKIYQPSFTELWSGTTSTDWQSFDVVFTAMATINDLKFATPAMSAGYTEWDKIELYDLSGPHYQRRQQQRQRRF